MARGFNLPVHRNLRVSEGVETKGPPVPGSNHERGGARMGRDPTSSVVDRYNRVWEATNVLVCDGARFPSILHQNPALTTMAFAVRASRQLLKKLIYDLVVSRVFRTFGLG